MNRSRTVRVILVSALLLVGPIGCSNEDAGSADTAPDLHDAAPDASPAKLTITVQELGQGATGPTLTPLQGVAVAADLPGGQRKEATTDASGEAIFDVDWSKGPVDVIAAKAGYVINSSSGLTKTAGIRELYMQKNTAPVSATITGKALGGDSTATHLSVSASTGLKYFNAAGTSYTLKVEAGKPSTIVGVLYKPSVGMGKSNFNEILLGWATADWDGKGTTATVDLDFSKPMTTTSFKGTMVPPAASCLLATTSYAWVMTSDYRLEGQSFFLGYMKSRTYANDIYYSYDGEYVTSKAATNPMTFYTLFTPFEAQMSYVIKDGYPQDGAKITGFICEPTLTKPTPTELTIPLKLSTKITWTSPDTFQLGALSISDKDDRVVWQAMVPAGATSLSLPELPTGINLADLLGTTALNAGLTLCADQDLSSMVCRRGATTKMFRLAPSF